MHADVLIAEIGSTTTLMNAFRLGQEPRYLGQGMAPTTVLEGDVRVGLSRALADLEAKLGSPLSYDRMLATSSAAGGLRMSVHGLVYDMTVRAAEAAALGAGGVIRQVTGGKMSPYDLMDLKALHPNLILIAGGTDFGERATALYNCEQIAALGMTDVPVLYAGNVQNQNVVTSLFQSAGIPLFLTENVYDAGNGRKVGAGGLHLKLDLIQESQPYHQIPSIAFNMADYYDYIREGNPIDICYAIVENYYRGSASIQLRIRDIREREDIL